MLTQKLNAKHLSAEFHAVARGERPKPVYHQVPVVVRLLQKHAPLSFPLALTHVNAPPFDAVLEESYAAAWCWALELIASNVCADAG